MKTAIILVIVSIIDIPSIISIIGGLKAKKLWQVFLVAFVAAVIGEVLSVSLNSAYSMLSFFMYKLFAQIIVALTVFAIVQKIRKHNSSRPDQIKRNMFIFSAFLLLSFCSLSAGIIFLGVSKGKTFISDSKNQYKKDSSVQVSSSKNINEGDKGRTGNILLYRETVETYWNDWTGEKLSGGKVLIKGIGKTAAFEGAVQLKCESESGYDWLEAKNSYDGFEIMESDLDRIVPVQVIPAAFAEFCGK
ncbi:MAG: hypothetical protein J0L77_08470 [Alphaproteobacteria bacterium]|nr:hypothetical protein [Alphaproteobacteria bacterium]